MLRLFVSILFIGFTAFINAQCLVGTYTVGGMSPDYPTINDAVNALEYNGICGNVYLNIRDGVYHEQINIDSIPGSSINNQTFFRSESMDSSLVELTFLASSSPSTPDSNYVLRMDSINYIHFEHLSFSRLVPAFELYASVISLGYYTSNVSFNNCQFKTEHSSLGNGSQTLITNDAGTNEQYIEISNCHFEGGTIGVEFKSPGSTQLELGNKIEHCTFFRQSDRSIQVENQSDFSILNNEFLSPNHFLNEPSYQSSFVSMNLTDCKNSILSGNKINLTPDTTTYAGVYSYDNERKYYWGIWVKGSAKLSNNFISGSVSEDALTGGFFQTFSGDTIEFIHNSISFIHEKAAVALHLRPGYNGCIINKNNILQVKRLSGNFEYPLVDVYFPSTSMYNSWSNLIKSDHNSYWHNVDHHFYEVFGNDIGTISALRNVSGQDLNSIYRPAAFSVEGEDLHIQYDTDLFQGGEALGVVDDIDSEVRNVLPCIGADEFINSSVDDMGVTSIDTASMFQLCPGSSHNLTINIHNYGTNPVQSCLVHYQVNDSVYDPVSWSGNLNSFQSEGVLVDFHVPESRYAKLKMWTSTPNTVVDNYKVNDTLTFIVEPRLGGTYTIEQGEDFDFYSDAISHLERVGICGNVTFLVPNGTWTDFQINQKIPYSTILDTISIIGVGATPALLFHLEFNDTSSIQIKNIDIGQINIYKAENFIVDSCIFSPFGGTHTDTVYNNIEIRNSFFETSLTGSAGLGITKAHILENNVMGINVIIDCFADTILVRNNQLEGGALRLRESQYVLFENNRSYFPTSSINQVKLFLNSGKSIVRNNQIKFESLLIKSDSTVVHNNKLNLAEYDYSAGIISHSILSSNGTVFNNYFFCDTKGVNNPETANIQIGYDSGQEQVGATFQMVNNTFQLDTSFVFHILSDATNVEFTNNIVKCNNAQYENNALFELHSSNLDTTLVGSNNCFYYDTTVVDLILWNNGTTTNLPTYQSYGRQENSFIHLANFMQDSIHIVYDTLIVRNGVYIPNLLPDFDGDERDTLIDIGADQLSTDWINDVAVVIIDSAFCNGDSIYFKVINLDTIQEVNYFESRVLVNGIEVSHDYYIHNIPVNDTSDLLMMAPIHFTNNGNNQVELLIEYPNGNIDTISINNIDLYQINGLSPINLGEDTAICNNHQLPLEVYGSYNSILWSSGSASNQIIVSQPGGYSVATEDIYGCLDADTILIEYVDTAQALNLVINPISVDEFEFIATHVNADSLFWDFDDGNVLAMEADLNSDTVYYQYGLFGQFEPCYTVRNTCLYSVSVNCDTLSVLPGAVSEFGAKETINVFPNPANVEISIDANQLQVYKVELYNAVGQVVKHKWIGHNSMPFTINCSNLEPGIHLLKLYTSAGVISKQVVVVR